MRSIFHLAFFGLFALVCYTDSQIVVEKLLPIPNVFLSRFVWLTLIDLYLQTIYHFIGFVTTIVSPNKRHTIFDYISRAISGPLGVSVTVLFWGLFLFDPNTLANDEMGKKLMEMKWFNHGLHTLPLIAAHLDLFFWKHSEFSKAAVLKGISIFSTLYIIDIHYVHHVTGFWAYPILGELAPPFRLLFIAACIGVIFLSYSWLSFVHTLIHGPGGKSDKKTKKHIK